MRKTVVFITAFILVAGALLSVATASDIASFALRDSDLNFSENTQSAASMTLDEVLEGLLGQPVSDAEKNVLRYKFSGQNVLYYTKPDVNSPAVSYDGETGVLTLTLEDDFYVTQYGKEVIWTPVSATMGDRTVSFVQAPDLGDTYYRATFEGVDWAANVSLSIEYQSDFVLSAAALNEFVNFAYQRALSLDGEKQAYELKLTEYNQKVLDFERNRAEWEKYETDLDAYNVYLERLALYQSYLAYQQYLADVAQYEKDVADWKANVAAWQSYEQNLASYNDYLAYKAQYPTLKSKYESDMALVQHQLGLLELLQKPDSVTGASFVDRMIDDRMTAMIEEKRLALVILVDEATVDNAIAAAKYLRGFCTTLKGLTTPETQYRYYIKEQASFAKYLNMLYVNVSKIYGNNTVYKEIVKAYPDDMHKPVRMLASLYAYSCVFSDSRNLNLNTVIDTRNGTKASALVDPDLLPASDTNKATPLSAWPTSPANPESYPVKTQPTPPAQTLTEPTAPTPVKNPGVSNMEAPAVVAQPTPPAQTLTHPGAAPTLGWDDYLTALYQAYKSGEIVHRPTYASAQKVTLSAYGQYSAGLDSDQHYCFVQFYDSNQSGTYLGTVAAQYGMSAAYTGKLPTKPSDVYNDYTFDCWVLANSAVADLSSVTEDINVYARYTATPRYYTVTWDVQGVQTKQTYTYGQTPVFEGSTDKASTAQYSYAFIGWDKEIAPVSSDVTYRAEYSATLNRYTVTFDLGEGGIKTYTYTFGHDLRDVVYNLGIPEKSATAQYSYTFAGWKDQNGKSYADSAAFPMLVGDMTFSAQFEASVNYYKVIFDVEGVLTEQTLAYGETPHFGAMPTKQSTAQYDYTFVSWDHELAFVQGDVTYVACFAEQLRSYEINFVVDGVTYSSVVEYGTVPHFNGEVQKMSDVKYSYSFLGWDKDLVPVEGDATYTARFTETLRKYPVTFVVDGSEVTAEFDYGTVPAYPYGTPARPDDNRYRYVFAGWDNELATVDGTAARYTAQFDAVALAPVEGGGSGVLNVGANGDFGLQIDGTEADLSLIFQKAGESGSQLLTVEFGEGKLVFNSALINAFYNMGGGIASVSLAPTQHEGRTAYAITLLDEQGQPVAFLADKVKVMLPYSGLGAPDVYHVEKDGSLTLLTATLENGYLSFETMNFSTFVIKEKFKIESTETENGAMNVIDSSYDGETVTVELDPAEGYHIDTLSVTCNGESVTVSVVDGVYTFVMPRGDVHISATFKVVEGGTAAEVMVGVITAMLIVSIGIVIAVILRRKKHVKI